MANQSILAPDVLLYHKNMLNEAKILTAQIKALAPRVSEAKLMKDNNFLHMYYLRIQMLENIQAMLN